MGKGSAARSWRKALLKKRTKVPSDGASKRSSHDQFLRVAGGPCLGSITEAFKNISEGEAVAGELTHRDGKKKRGQFIHSRAFLRKKRKESVTEGYS